jgi:hypothetical protein
MQVCTDLLDGTIQHIQQQFTIHGVKKRERLVVEVDAAAIGSYLKWDRDEKMTGLILDGAPIQPEQATKLVTDLVIAAENFPMQRAGVIKTAFVSFRIPMKGQGRSIPLQIIAANHRSAMVEIHREKAVLICPAGDD